MPILTNAKHEAVALAYIADPQKIGWRAYLAAYPKSSLGACRTAWGRLLKNADFAARIAELAESAVTIAVMTAQEVLEELSKLGRSNMRNYMRPGRDGDPILHFDKLTDDQTAALAEVTVEDFVDGRGDDARDVRKVKFRLHPKAQALDLLAKHHKLYVDRDPIGLGGVAERLASALERIADGTEDDDGKERPNRRAPRGRRPRKTARKGKRTRA